MFESKAKPQDRGWSRARKLVLLVCLVAGAFGRTFRAGAQNLATPPLLLPVAVAYDSSGNLFFADARRHQVFELTLAGTWSIIAGTGEQGFAGDGGFASAALLNAPRGLVVGANGTLYIADTGNERIRAITNGVISTVAGSGVRGFSGDGVALRAALRDPTALALDASGNLLVCDTGNQRVRRISGGNMTTVAGNGVQGYSGDGSMATVAELDTPLGVSVTASGVILIADTHNQRVRSIGADGIIATFAGSGVKGFAGDGGPAIHAAFDLPYGLAVNGDGSVLVADTGNQRIRSISSQGVMSTVVGNGVQGLAVDATRGAAAPLNNPRAVSVQLQDQPVLADASNGLVRELASDNALYTLALLASPRVSSVTVSAGGSAIYGQGTANVQVTGSAAIPQGSITLRDGNVALGTMQLVAGSVSFSLAQLSVGSHALSAAYGGDGLNGSASSAAVPIAIKPASAIAVASPASAVYGSPLPSLTGILSGILPQDAATVSAAFSSAATALSPVGSYPITASLTGQGSTNYTLLLGANSGSLVISQAPTVSTLTTSAQTYAGLPMLLSASVATTTSGSPSGTVSFLDGGTVVNSATLTSGAANTTILSPAQGAHAYSARYSGAMNFLPSTSPMANVTVASAPDFSIALSPGSQSVQGGSSAMFTINVAALNGPFTGAVTFSVSGLPQGAVATFSPTAVVPGATTANATLSIQTVARTGMLENGRRAPLEAALSIVALLLWRPRRSPKPRRSKLLLLLAMTSLASLGCGTRTAGSAAATGQTSMLTVTGTATNITGTAVSHAATASLIVF